MRYILIFLFSLANINQFTEVSSDSFDLKIAMDAVSSEELKDNSPVILRIKVTNISKIKCPENAYKFTLFVNGKPASLDNNPSALMPEETITYTKQTGNYHFMAYKDSSYNISAKIEIKKGYEDSDMSNNQIQKLVIVK
jgi:hypothetical protein